MSLESWKKEFYPVTAQSRTLKTDIDRVKHSIKKWEGLRQADLARHGVKRSPRNGYILYAVDTLAISSDSCALCHKHLWNNMTRRKCGRCPLALERGGVKCDRKRHGEARNPWSGWTVCGLPRHMLYWLRRTLKKLEAGES